MPKNAAAERRYSGINVLILWGAVVQHGFPGQSWLTFRQALRLGGNVRKGERGTTVVFADRFIPDQERARAREQGDEPNAIPFLKRFTVFNVAQCDGLAGDLVTVPPPVPDGLILPEVEALIRASGADLRLGGDKAFYSPDARLHSGAATRGVFRADQLAAHGAPRARPLVWRAEHGLAATCPAATARRATRVRSWWPR